MTERRSLRSDFAERIAMAAGLDAAPVPDRLIVIAGRSTVPVVFLESPGGLWLRYDWPDGLAGRAYVSPTSVRDLIGFVIS